MGGGETLLPDFMKIVLSNGFEAELLNEFSPAGSQVTLIPPLTAAEANRSASILSTFMSPKRTLKQ